MADVPLLVISEYAASERRITPSWSIFQLKTKLEPVTGIPPSFQRLSLKTSAGSEKISVEAADEDAVRLSSFPLAPYAELHVSQPLSISLVAESAAGQGCGVLLHTLLCSTNVSACLSLSASPSLFFFPYLRVCGGEGLLCNRPSARKRTDEIPKRASYGGLWAAKRFSSGRVPLLSMMERLYAFAGDADGREEGGAYMETKLTRHAFVGH